MRSKRYVLSEKCGNGEVFHHLKRSSHIASDAGVWIWNITVMWMKYLLLYDIDKD